jgi:diacylglycerol kinase (ATP)
MWIRIGVPGDCLSQAKRIRIVTNLPLPMQVDGEPCILQPSEITIELKNQATMITSLDKNHVRV